MYRSRGGTGGPDPHPEKSQKYRVSFQYCWGSPQKNYKATKSAFNIGHHRPTSETPFKWRFAGGQIIAHVNRYSDPISPHQLKKATFIKFGPPLTKLSRSAHDMTLSSADNPYKQFGPRSGPTFC